MTTEHAVRAGGWDPRYAVVRALVSHDDIAAVVVDPNGDGGDIDLDQYHRGPDGRWVADGSHGSAGDFGTTWSPHMVTTFGRTAPGALVLVDYLGEVSRVQADGDGWWLYATGSLDDETMPRIRSGD